MGEPETAKHLDQIVDGVVAAEAAIAQEQGRLGHGVHDVGPQLDGPRVDFLGVAYVDEGIELRKNGLQLPIMVMNPTLSSFPKMIEHNLDPEIYNFELLNAYSSLADGESVPGIHLKIDTGMHRLGFHPEEVNEIISLLKKSNLRLASIFSHLASSEDQKHHSFTKSQIKLFKEVASKIESTAGHCLNHILNLG